MADDKAWNRKTEETDEQFALFELYLKERNTREVARQRWGESRVESGHVYVVQLKKRFQWDARCLAFDRWAGSVRDEGLSEQIKREINTIGKKRLALLRDLYAVTAKVKNQVMPAGDAPIKIGDAYTYAKIAQVLLDEYRKLEDANPAKLDDAKPFEQEIDSAKALLVEQVRKLREQNEKGAEQVLQ